MSVVAAWQLEVTEREKERERERERGREGGRKCLGLNLPS